MALLTSGATSPPLPVKKVTYVQMGQHGDEVLIVGAGIYESVWRQTIKYMRVPDRANIVLHVRIFTARALPEITA